MQGQEHTAFGNPVREELNSRQTPPLDKNTCHRIKSLKEMPNLASLPEVPPSFDFWGVLPVVIDPDHLVALIVLAKVASCQDGSPVSGIFPSLWAATQDLQAHILSSVDKAEMFAAMLSRGIVPPTSTEGGVEVNFGPDSLPVGFSLGGAHVQAVMTCVILADDESRPDPSVLFPFISNDIVDTYLLPATTDFGKFGRYLTEKTQQVQRGKHLPVISKNGFNNPRLLSHVLVFGGMAVIIYSIAAFLFMLPLLNSAPFVIYDLPFVLLFIVTLAVALWKRNSRLGRIIASNYIRGMTWRAVDCAPGVVQEISTRLSQRYASQFSYEMNATSSSN